MLLALIGLAVTEIALWGRRQQARASTRAGYLEGVVAAAQLAASGTTSPSDVVELVGRQIGDVLDLDACAFDPGPSQRDRPRLEAGGGITWRGRAVDVDREGLPTLDVIELPVTLRGRRPRAIPADVDEHGATSRPGTAAGRRHARRAGCGGPCRICAVSRPSRRR